MASAAYEYPTPAQIDAERAGNRALQSRGGVAQPLDQQILTTPLVGGPNPWRSFRQWLGVKILGADGSQAFFPPLQPLQPNAQQPITAAPGRPWDYPIGWNTRVTPRSGTPIPFATLKQLADGYDVLRIIIERVKDRVIAQSWTVGPKDKRKARDARCDELEDFFAFPDKVHPWGDWLRMLLEQTLVYDAPAIWLQPDRGGRLYGLQIIDGAMISPKIMADGRLPPPAFGPAYQQVLKGLPAVDYVQPVPLGQPAPLDPDGDPFPELLYRPRNLRIDSLYGYSPVEQILATIGIALRREAFLAAYYTDGSTPDLIFQVPDNWSAEQIRKFKTDWDAMLAGNLQNRRGTQFVPGGGGAKPIDTKEKALTDETDQWLVRIICFAFGLNPMPFIKQMNKGQEATHHQESQEEGLAPWLRFVADLMNQVVLIKFGYRDIEFRWEEAEVTDPIVEAQRFQILCDTKIMHPDEARNALGMDAMPDDSRGQMDMATYSRTPNATILPDEQQAARDASAQARAAAMPAPAVAGGIVGKARRAGSNRSTARVIPY